MLKYQAANAHEASTASASQLSDGPALAVSKLTSRASIKSYSSGMSRQTIRLVPELRLEPAGKFYAMVFLHHENNVRPFELIRRQRRHRVRCKTGGVGLHVRPTGEDLLGSRAAQAVAGAEEEGAFHFTQLSESDSPSA